MNLKLKSILTVSFLFFISFLFAQEVTTKGQKSEQRILIHINSQNEKYINYKLKPGDTLFNIKKFYGVSINSLYRFNPNIDIYKLKSNHYLKIPISNILISRFKKPNQDSLALPVYYQVKKGETLYDIATRKMKMDVTTFIQENNLESNQLKVGQLLKLGYLNPDGYPDSLRTKIENNVHTQLDDISEYDERGIAQIMKNSKDIKQFYVLHRSFPKNSSIFLTNPMNRKRVKVKVIGNIPNSIYSEEILVVIPEIVAKRLQIKDEKFFVKIQK